MAAVHIAPHSHCEVTAVLEYKDGQRDRCFVQSQCWLKSLLLVLSLYLAMRGGRCRVGTGCVVYCVASQVHAHLSLISCEAPTQNDLPDFISTNDPWVCLVFAMHACLSVSAYSLDCDMCAFLAS
jgi:hypothetical protein